MRTGAFTPVTRGTRTIGEGLGRSKGRDLKDNREGVGDGMEQRQWRGRVTMRGNNRLLNCRMSGSCEPTDFSFSLNWYRVSLED